MHQVPTTYNTMATEQTSFHSRFSFSNCRRRRRRRHSYPLPTTTCPLGKRKSANSIPIARQDIRKTADSEQHQIMAQDKAAEAYDYKDFVFFSRVVGGISRQNSLLQDGSYLKSTNQTLLDSIVKSRHEQEENKVEDDQSCYHNHYNCYPSKQRCCHQDLKIVTPTRDHYAVDDDSALHVLTFPEHDEHNDRHHHYDDDHHEEEDEGVFDFEL